VVRTSTQRSRWRLPPKGGFRGGWSCRMWPPNWWERLWPQGHFFFIFSPWLATKEAEKGVVRGQPGSEVTAMCYGEYFPSPGPLATASGPYSPEAAQRLNALVSESAAFLAEMLGTMILGVVVFAVTDPRNPEGPGRLAPVLIGLMVVALISVIAPLTQACFNPARDFGSRLFAFLTGWGQVALPGPTPTGFFSVYIAARLMGAILGAHLYDRVLHPAKPDASS